MCTRNQAFEILKIVYHACDPILGHSIHDAILYGSYARGDFTAESDIDILLTADLTQEQIASQRHLFWCSLMVDSTGLEPVTPCTSRAIRSYFPVF